MAQCDAFLRSNARRIAERGAELLDAEVFVEPLCRVVLQLAGDFFAAGPLDVSPLREAGADDALAGRLLRAMEAECIEVLREGTPEKMFAECVLSLRERVRKSVVRQLPPAWCLELGRELVSAPGQGEGVGKRLLANFFRSVMDTQRDMVYAHDVNGNLFYLNDRGLEIIKFTREDLFDGMSVYDFVVPEYMDLVEARLESPGAILRSPYTVEIYSKDGERVPIEIDTRPMLDEKGEVAAVVGIAHDLRLERRLQEEIRRSNAQLENVVANAPIGIIIADTRGIIRDANPAAVALCGAPGSHALIGLPVDHFSEEPGLEVHAACSDVLRTGEERRLRHSMKTRFGAEIHCDILVAATHMASPSRGHSGAIDGLVMLLHDVREEVALQQSLVQSEKLSSLGEIVAGVAHELNNPLTGVLGFSQLLLNSVTDPDAQGRLGQIMEAAQRCRRIVECLMSFAQRVTTQKSRQDINELFKEALNLCRYQLRIDGIEVEMDLQSDLPWLEVDPYGLQRVFLHLISNAHQALATVAGRGRKLTLRTRVINHTIEAVVSDNGPGIPPDKLSKVFDPFFTTKGPTERPGLGLSVAYGIVREHGGVIRADSTFGRGATFTVALPVVQ